MKQPDNIMVKKLTVYNSIGDELCDIEFNEQNDSRVEFFIHQEGVSDIVIGNDDIPRLAEALQLMHCD